MNQNDDLILLSKGGLFPHTHKLVIPKNILTAVQATDVVLTTSSEYSLIFKHKHSVLLTVQTIQQILRNESVVLKDIETGRHTFQIN